MAMLCIWSFVPIILHTGFGGLGGFGGPAEEAPPADALASGPAICLVRCWSCEVCLLRCWASPKNFWGQLGRGSARSFFGRDDDGNAHDTVFC